MDFLTELEGMASNIVVLDDTIDLAKWRSLFGYTTAEAQTAVDRLQSALDPIVSQALWDAVREQKEPFGHDRLTYSHWILRNKRQKRGAGPVVDGRDYLVQLYGVLDSPASLTRLAGIQQQPAVLTATSEHGGPTQFCRISAMAKATLLERLARDAPDFSPLIVPSSRAKKDLCAHTKAPFIGVDSTLPQNRLDDTHPAAPAQDQYPVWYFFYGTLGDPVTLKAVLGNIDSAKTYELFPARIRGGKMCTWGAGKYKGLIDGFDDDVTEGSAFLVESKAHEDALCYYETHSYDAARCRIEIVRGDETRLTDGCTFQFVGLPD